MVKKDDISEEQEDLKEAVLKDLRTDEAADKKK